jgi:hypothetical protein
VPVAQQGVTRVLGNQFFLEPDALPFEIITQRFLRQLIQFSGFGVAFDLSLPWLFPCLHEFFKLAIGQVHDNVFELLRL